MDMTTYLRQFLEVVPAKLADGMKQAGDELAVYISDNMINAANPNPRVKRTDSDPRLYRNGGRLERAATVPNAQGNVTEVRYQSGEIIYEAGVDLSVVPYARIHEYGGKSGRGLKANIPARPYLEPGIRDYIEDDNNGLSQTIDDIMSKIERFLK